MCGIAGFTTGSIRPEAAAPILEDMCLSLRQRGPDSQGMILWPGVALGMRRLSIVDVSGGDQPLFNEDRSIALVCNGEIYNSPQLREQLQRQGHTFRTRSDCEVIVHAYEQWDTAFLQQVNGMFGLALWDQTRRRLLLARDRAGIKPLHYALVPDGLVFGSEIKALLRHPQVPRKLDVEALLEYLSYEYVPSPRTMFRSVQKLPPGHYLTFTPGQPPRVKAYWDFVLGAESTAPPPAKDVAAELRDVLQQAVGMELMSDVPVGVLLSGGVDSSTVAALMARCSSAPVDSFAVAFDDPSFDESRCSRLAAEYIGTRHHELVLRPQDLWRLIPEVVSFMDEPLGDSSLIPTYALSRFARQHVKVALGGDGGDELFGGYPTLKAHRAAGYLRYVRSPAAAMLAAGARRLPVSHDNISFDFKVKRFAAGLPLPLPERHQLWLGSLSHDEAWQCLSPEARMFLDGERRPYEPSWQHLDGREPGSELNSVLHLDFKLYLENDILVKVDRASMACGLETRVPLLNRVVVDYASALPADLKLRGWTTKYILKQAAKGLIPDSLINRPKKGFNMPVARWFAGELRPLLEATLNPQKLEGHGVLQAKQISTLLEDHFSGRRDNRKPLWTLFTFQQWYDRYFGSSVQPEGNSGPAKETQPATAAA